MKEITKMQSASSFVTQRCEEFIGYRWESKGWKEKEGEWKADLEGRTQSRNRKQPSGLQGVGGVG